jgi:hypothetical protein
VPGVAEKVVEGSWDGFRLSGIGIPLSAKLTE